MWASLVERRVMMISVYGLLILKRLLGTLPGVMIHVSGGFHGLLRPSKGHLAAYTNIRGIWILGIYQEDFPRTVWYTHGSTDSLFEMP